MNRSRWSLVVLVAALAFLAVQIPRLLNSGGSIKAQLHILEGGRGYALAQKISADHPEGGTAILLIARPALDSEKMQYDSVLAGLKAGGGAKLRWELYEATESPADPNLPSFLQERLAGNAHLQSLEQALATRPGAVAVVTKLDPNSDLPTSIGKKGTPDLYVLGFGEASAWEKIVASKQFKAIQIDRPEGYTLEDSPRQMSDSAKRYYNVIPGS